jgi:hypothetical protein
MKSLNGVWADVGTGCMVLPGDSVLVITLGGD